MDNQQVRLLFNISWICGIIEGEGCIGLHPMNKKMKNGLPYYYPRISITNSDYEILNACILILKELQIR